jgi:hypothetical protein
LRGTNCSDVRASAWERGYSHISMEGSR